MGAALAAGAGVASAAPDDASHTGTSNSAGVGNHNPAKVSRPDRGKAVAALRDSTPKAKVDVAATPVPGRRLPVLAPSRSLASAVSPARAALPSSTTLVVRQVAPVDRVAAAASPTANLNPLAEAFGNFENFLRVTSRWAITGLNRYLSPLGLALPVPGLPAVQKATPTSRLWTRLMAFTDPGVDADGFMPRIVQGADGQTRLVVYIGGTTPFNGANQPALDNPAKLQGEVEAAQLNELLSVLNGDKSLPIMLTGFSQGGMDAQNLANALVGMGYNVQGVVCFASPFTQDTPAPYPIAYLRDKLDPVAVLQRPGVAIDRTKVFTTTSSSDKNPGIGNINVHINDATYNEIARKFDVYAGGFSAIKHVIRLFEPTDTLSDTTPPTQPILRFNGVFADRISLYPQGGTDNVGIVGYYIYRDGIRIGPRIDPGGKYIDSTLIPGVGYVFYTTAVDLAGNESIGSAAIKADPARGT
jgi:hypothetical protein